MTAPEPTGRRVPAPATDRLWDPERRLLLVGIVCLITVVATEAMAVSTVMPLVEDDLGDIWLYGWAFSAFYLGDLVGIVLGGRAADRVAPVVPLLIGLATFTAGLVLGGLAPSMAVLVLGRCLQGVGAGVVPAVAYVCVGRGFPELRDLVEPGWREQEQARQPARRGAAGIPWPETSSMTINVSSPGSGITSK